MKLPALFTQVKWEIKHLRGTNPKSVQFTIHSFNISIFRGQFPRINAFTSENNTCQFLCYD
jgi:hypothetical protein